ncbi:MAG: hypothetical protein JWQ47_951 [Glaciihabitans sp.]|jgi:hypothetical protein|nr:hypothetical protein [Glaciihabitans sp.]
MSQFASVPERLAEEPGAEVVLGFTTDTRRWLQLALAALWVFDGLLQFQTYMFTKAFATQILAPNAAGNPTWIADSILWTARVVETNPVLTNTVFATLQLAIGLAIAWRRSLRTALAVSIAWSLIVWWFGEGLGGLLLGHASALDGAPGGVLLYLVLAILLWPTTESTVGTFVASRPVGPVAAKIIWIVLWGGLAALNLQPANLKPGALHSMLSGMGTVRPTWLAALIESFAALSAQDGTPLTIIGAVILFLVALGILLPPRWMRVTVAAAVAVSVFIWVIGEAIGAPFGGQSTDPNSGPLLTLIAIAYWPARKPTIPVPLRAGVTA